VNIWSLNMVMQIVWRLRSPISGGVTACLLVEDHQNACELLIVPVERDERPVSSRYADTKSASHGAATLASTLRADGWTDTSDEPPT
jgi:hypothetical protein